MREMWKRTKRLLCVKTDNGGGHCRSDGENDNAADGDGLSSRAITPEILEAAAGPPQSMSDGVFNRKLTQFAADMDAVSNDKAETHAVWLAQMRNVQRLEEKLEKSTARAARLMADNGRLEAANGLLGPLSAENDVIAARLVEMETEKMKMQLALSAAFAATQRYSVTGCAHVPGMTSA